MEIEEEGIPWVGETGRQAYVPNLYRHKPPPVNGEH